MPASSARHAARDRLEAALARIAAPGGEGARTYLTLYAETARKAADAADMRARAGRAIGPMDGAIISIKDLFDVAGEPTRAGSLILADAPPARTDARVVMRLRRAGAVIVGKTNMVEFAFSGVGLNAHYGTPRNPADRTRVPGGSTSGGGVAVADGMCEIAIGTDTGGSTRIPAALCGVVGFKPSTSRVPTDGAFPLSPTLDSVGPIARTVADCARADAVMAGDAPRAVEPATLSGLRFGIAQGLPLKDLDETVAARFAEAVAMIGRGGVRLSDETLPMLDAMAGINSPVPLVTVEAFAIHKARLAAQGGRFDPFVRARIESARDVTAEQHGAMLRARAGLVQAMDARLADLDVLILPTTPIVAPTIAEVSDAEGFAARNRMLLRNTAIANFFDLCAISLPMPRAGGLPTGLMLFARHGQDRRLIQIALAVEACFGPKGLGTRRSEPRREQMPAIPIEPQHDLLGHRLIGQRAVEVREKLAAARLLPLDRGRQRGEIDHSQHQLVLPSEMLGRGLGRLRAGGHVDITVLQIDRRPGEGAVRLQRGELLLRQDLVGEKIAQGFQLSGSDAVPASVPIAGSAPASFSSSLSSMRAALTTCSLLATLNRRTPAELRLMTRMVFRPVRISLAWSVTIIR
jgi:aspartyl-tRNA(Asn)/glutamyl-tRNA(Gln) amidotransferase subunit A